jgi:hypothetical protein
MAEAADWMIAMNETELIYLALFPVFFIFLWCFILWIFSFTSGWRLLAARYPYPDPFEGEAIRFQSAKMNLVNFKNVLYLGCNREGLYLNQMVLFRLFHQPVLIPWEEIIAEPYQRRFFQGYQLIFRSVPNVKLMIYRSTFDWILDYLRKNTGFRVDNQLGRNEFRR